MKKTKQRALIEAAVLENKIHPTANEVYYIVKQKQPNISLATVYRNLNFLVEHNIIQKIAVANKCDHFDGTLSEHYHMICDCCGMMIDCPIDPLNQIDQQIESKTGFQVTSHHLIVHGICETCFKK